VRSCRAAAAVTAALALFAAFPALAEPAPQADAPPAQGAQQPRPRDAAEAVQEGNVTRWLEHYQRERGEAWARDRNAAPADPPEPAAPVQTDE
jgi:hypothetical protein